MKFHRLAVLLSSFALFAQQPVGSQRVLGLLLQANEGVIVAPDKVRVGQEFPVSITTVGGGCDEEGDNGVIHGDGGASIYVYDFSAANQPNIVCPAIIKQFRHDVILSFAQPGQAVAGRPAVVRALRALPFAVRTRALLPGISPDRARRPRASSPA